MPSILLASPAAAEAQLQALSKRLDPVRTKANEARQKLSELEKEQKGLEGKLGGSYGEADAYVALVDRCFEAKVGWVVWRVGGGRLWLWLWRLCPHAQLAPASIAHARFCCVCGGWGWVGALAGGQLLCCSSGGTCRMRWLPPPTGRLAAPHSGGQVYV